MLIISSLILLMGIAHVSLTLATYEEFSLDALWFAGSGIALIILAFLQFVLLYTEVKSLFLVFGHIGNLLAVTLVLLLITLAFQWHIIFLFCLLFIQSILFIFYHFKSRIISSDG